MANQEYIEFAKKDTAVIDVAKKALEGAHQDASDASVSAFLDKVIAENGEALEQCSDPTSFALTLSAFVSSVAIEQNAGGPASNPQAPTTGSQNTITKQRKASGDAAVTEEDKAMGENVLEEIASSAAANRQKWRLTGILTRKPSVTSRLNGTTTMTIKVTDAIGKKLSEYTPADGGHNAEDLQQLRDLYEKAKTSNGTLTTEVYVNKTARPVIEAYRFTNIEDNSNADIPKNRAALRAYVTVNFAGLLPEAVGADGKTTMGAYLRTVESKQNVGVSTTSAVITKTKDYWENNPEGITTYETVPGDEMDDLTVRSAMSALVKSAPGSKVPNRVVRLYGTVKVPKIKRKAEFEQKWGPISQGIGNGGMSTTDIDPNKIRNSTAKSIALTCGKGELAPELAKIPGMQNVFDLFKKKKSGNTAEENI